jgi:hypothetical protein
MDHKLKRLIEKSLIHLQCLLPEKVADDARKDVPALCKVVRKQDKRIAELEEEVAELRHNRKG